MKSCRSAMSEGCRTGRRASTVVDHGAWDGSPIASCGASSAVATSGSTLSTGSAEPADEPTRERTVVAGFTAEAYAFQDKPAPANPGELAKADPKNAKSKASAKSNAKKPAEAK